MDLESLFGLAFFIIMIYLNTSYIFEGGAEVSDVYNRFFNDVISIVDVRFVILTVQPLFLYLYGY